MSSKTGPAPNRPRVPDTLTVILIDPGHEHVLQAWLEPATEPLPPNQT